MVTTSSWRWPPHEAICTRHEAFLGALLDSELPGSADMRVVDPRARRSAQEHSGSERPFASDPPLRWLGSGDQGDVRSGVAELGSDLRLLCRSFPNRSDDVDQSSLSLYRHRIHLDRERTNHLFGDPTLRADVELCLDVRFRYVVNELVCHTSLSIWSHSPWSDRHRPEPDRMVASRAVDLRDLRDAFVRIQHTADLWIRRQSDLHEQELRVFDQPYRSPVFWVVVPADAEITPPQRYLQRVVDDATAALLGGSTSRENGVGLSVVNDELLVARRFAEGDNGDIPTYVLLAGRPADVGSGDGKGIPPREADPDETRWDITCRRLADQEDRIRRVITVLTAFESEAAGRLFHLQSDLEVLENHLTVYGHAVERGGGLWDGMAAHLLHHRGRQLSKVHKSIELIHQTMLQGVADVDQVRSQVHERAAAVGEVGDHLRARLGRDLHEAPVDGSADLSTGICARGHLARVSERAVEVTQIADRIATSYRDLVQAISDAFDERRARETDVLQRTTFVVGLTLGLVGLMTAADTTFTLSEAPSMGRELLRGSVWAMAGLLGIGLVIGSVTFVRLGRVGSIAYRRRYRQVWEVLRYCSTEHLLTVARRLQSEPNHTAESKKWDELDECLSTRFARAWDAVTMMKGDVRQPADRQTPNRPLWWDRVPFVLRYRIMRDRRQLSRMIEKWSLRTFLITERPRELWRLNLPRLTLLYSAALQMLDRHDYRAVSTMDFYFVFSAEPHLLNWQEVRALQRWLDRQTDDLREADNDDGYPTQIPATSVLERITVMGVTAHGSETVRSMLAETIVGIPEPTESSDQTATSEVVSSR